MNIYYFILFLNFVRLILFFITLIFKSSFRLTHFFFKSYLIISLIWYIIGSSTDYNYYKIGFFELMSFFSSLILTFYYYLSERYNLINDNNNNTNLNNNNNNNNNNLNNNNNNNEINNDINNEINNEKNYIYIRNPDETLNLGLKV